MSSPEKRIVFVTYMLTNTVVCEPNFYSTMRPRMEDVGVTDGLAFALCPFRMKDRMKDEYEDVNMYQIVRYGHCLSDDNGLNLKYVQYDINGSDTDGSDTDGQIMQTLWSLGRSADVLVNVSNQNMKLKIHKSFNAKENQRVESYWDDITSPSTSFPDKMPTIRGDCQGLLKTGCMIRFDVKSCPSLGGYWYRLRSNEKRHITQVGFIVQRRDSVVHKMFLEKITDHVDEYQFRRVICPKAKAELPYNELFNDYDEMKQKHIISVVCVRIYSGNRYITTSWIMILHPRVDEQIREILTKKDYTGSSRQLVYYKKLLLLNSTFLPPQVQFVDAPVPGDGSFKLCRAKDGAVYQSDGMFGHFDAGIVFQVTSIKLPDNNMCFVLKTGTDCLFFKNDEFILQQFVGYEERMVCMFPNSYSTTHSLYIEDETDKELNRQTISFVPLFASYGKYARGWLFLQSTT